MAGARTIAMGELEAPVDKSRDGSIRDKHARVRLLLISQLILL
jgi:hypothetical protein